MSPDLVAYYPLDEELVLHYDLSVNRLHFEYIYPTPYVPCFDSSPLLAPVKGLTDVTDPVIKMDVNAIPIPCYNKAFSSTEGFTVEFWFYLEDNTQDDYSFIGIAGRPIYQGFEIVYKKSRGRIWCHINNSNDMYPPLFAHVTPTLNVWHHVSCANTNQGSGWSQFTYDDQVVSSSYISYSYTCLIFFRERRETE